MTKEQYITPEMEIIVFENEDVITTSDTSSLINGGTGIPTEIGYSDLFD